MMSPEPTAIPAALSSRPNVARRLTILSCAAQSCPALSFSALVWSGTGGSNLSEVLADKLEVIAFLHDRAQRVARDVRVQVLLAKEMQGPGPVDGLRDPRWLLEVQLPEAVHRRDHLPGELH